MKNNLVAWIREKIIRLCARFCNIQSESETVVKEKKECIIHNNQKERSNNHECQECRKNSDLEELKETKAEDLFYYIDTLSEEDLEMNFQIVLEKIAKDYQDYKERALICFDRLINKIAKKIDFRHEAVKHFLEKNKDFRFKLIVIFNPYVDQETLIQFLEDEDSDVKKSAQERLKRDFGFVDSNFETSHAKDILYLAKQIASEELSETILLEHIKRSAVSFNIFNQELIQLLGDLPKYEKSENIREKIKKAKEEKIIKYDDDCKKSELLLWLLKNDTAIVFKG